LRRGAGYAEIVMHIRTLAPTDAPTLLAFELANRDWFAAHIEARAPDFYNLAGVAAHIDDCLERYAAGTMHPCLLLDAGGAIVGRCNLKDIDHAERRAEVGYRIAREACGRGLAGQALDYLMQLAYGRWQLQGLDAHVTAANAASARVLSRAGFSLAGPSPIQAQVAGQLLDCLHFRHR
jgi:ribosomal-protein-alanine N-acetyltransferase